ncbi:hybrid sensor histidine kinase/response regulator [Aeromonas simiae]|uniref:hybrid sensor histidine kinase/response regulator n=1 Tax=Aeromonas simiae TaxID=218936 RepID=UPI00266DA66A|nr:response regulator [Aeromonas simiae]MDO2947683.1 response regulator [Aeromonas simiae]MDO2952303.1 response regulator [Aeromonas simiae]MDO2954898.1 response regulator [Aeromonas simiae]
MKGIIREYLLWLLPIALLLVAGGALLGHVLVERELYRLRSDENTFLSLATSRLEDELEVPYRHIQGLAEDPLLQEAVRAQRPDELEPLLRPLMRRNPDYAQVRWIDEQGMERIRLTREGKKIVRQPQAALQNRQQRDYFRQAVTQPGDRVYFSPLTLAKHDEQLLQPLTPEFRVARHLPNGAGILLLNVRAEKMLDAFVHSSGKAADHLTLVNQDGYWLHHPDKTQQWGMELGRPHLTMAQLTPEAWRRIWHAPNGQVELDDGLWSWESLYPAQDHQQQEWKAITMTSRAQLTTLRWHVWRMIGAGEMALLLLYGAGVAWLVRSRRRERAAQQEAARLSRVKGDFIANMSHEIRTPMNAIMGLTYLLEQGGLNDAQRDLVRKIHLAGQALLGIINDILDFSKIESGRLELEHVPFSLEEVLDHVAVIMSTCVGEKHLELVVGSAPAQAPHLVGDALRLEQVLLNLAGNAIKFTESGEVELKVSLQEESEEGVRLRFSMRDTGIGISANQQAHIFNAFSQADSSTTRRFGGTGLGLTISRRIVELMGGTLRVNSEVGKGSEFWFDLPFERVANAEALTERLQHISLLIADDSDVTRETLERTVDSLGWSACVVSSGEQALHHLLQRGDRFDVIVLDWIMPGLDGLQTCQAIRQAFAEQERSPIIIMATAYSHDELLGQPGADGIDMVLHKPVTGSSLYNAVARLLHDKREHQPAAAPGAVLQRLPEVRVLLVDDSDINLEVATRLLEREGALVQCAINGERALALLAEPEQAFDVVLMDVQMPIMDGYEATRRLRALPGREHLPVLALTAGVFREQREEALAAGMNDFIAKPLDVELLIATLLRYLPRQVYPVTVPAEVSAAEEIDIDTGLRNWGEASVYLKYLRRFRDDYMSVDKELPEYLVHHQLQEAATLTHKLKGVAGSLSLTDIAQASSELNEAIEQGQDPQPLVAPFLAAMERTRLAIEHYAGGGPTQEVVVQDDLSMQQESLEALRQALASEDLELIEPALLRARAHMPGACADAIGAALEQFDIGRAGEELARYLAGKEGVT